MYKSKAKATPEEIEELRKLYRDAQSIPVIAISGAHAMAGGFSADARGRTIRRMDEIASAHGLQPQTGEWGLDEDGHFLSEHPIVESEETVSCKP